MYFILSCHQANRFSEHGMANTFATLSGSPRHSPVNILISFLQHTDLIKSGEDPNTYLVNSTGDPMQQSLSGLLLDGLPPSASAAFLPKTGLHFTFLVCLCMGCNTPLTATI